MDEQPEPGAVPRPGLTRPTIEDVARLAGVGLGTASRALSDRPGVAPATRQRVLAAAERLGYRPSAVARAFSRRRTHTLELLVPLFTRPFFVEVLRGVEAALADTDYALVLRTVERARDRDQVFAACCLPGRADGVLIVCMQPTARLVERLGDTGLPVVLVDVEHPGLASVVVDHAAGAALAVRHCIELGHQRIALIDRPQDPFGPVALSPRQHGYRTALVEAGLDRPAAYERVVAFSPEAGAAALAELLALPRPPTAVVAGSDTQAIGMLEAARKHGLRVPEDLSIVGYNDIELAPFLGLTTVRVPMQALGRQGAAVLLDALDRPGPPPPTIRLPTELVVRQTCAPPGGTA